MRDDTDRREIMATCHEGRHLPNAVAAVVQHNCVRGSRQALPQDLVVGYPRLEEDDGCR